MNNIAIIYHNADFDGKLSNEACRYWLAKLYPDATIHSYGWDYGRPLPTVFDGCSGDAEDGTPASWSDYDLIYIVDLSVDELMGNEDLRSKIVWIDHHKSAINKWDRLADMGDKPCPYFMGYRIDGVAACRLCWQWFLVDMGDYGPMPNKQDYLDRQVDEPMILRLAGEYDIWDHRDPRGKALQFGLRQLSPEGLASLIRVEFDGVKDSTDGDSSKALEDCVLSGIAIKRYCDINNDAYARNFCQTIHWRGLCWCALNIGQRGNSDLLRGGIKPEHQALFAWRWTGSKVSVSLYHAPGHEDLDLSEIAVAFNGGGHRGACGFTTTLSHLEGILT